MHCIVLFFPPPHPLPPLPPSFPQSCLLENHKSAAAAQTALQERNQALLTWQSVDADVRSLQARLERITAGGGAGDSGASVDLTRVSRLDELKCGVEEGERARRVAEMQYLQVKVR